MSISVGTIQRLSRDWGTLDAIREQHSCILTSLNHHLSFVSKSQIYNLWQTHLSKAREEREREERIVEEEWANVYLTHSDKAVTLYILSLKEKTPNRHITLAKKGKTHSAPPCQVYATQTLFLKKKKKKLFQLQGLQDISLTYYIQSSSSKEDGNWNANPAIPSNQKAISNILK